MAKQVMKEYMENGNGGSDKTGARESGAKISVANINDYSAASQIWVALQHGELTSRAFNRLLAGYGAIEALLSAEAADLQEKFVLEDDAASKVAGAYEFLPQAEIFINTLAVREINYVTTFDKTYPGGFRELNDPPPIVFYRGELIDNEAKTVALVGTSSASQEGISVAVDFGSRAAAAGVTLISGLTKGIDTSALVGAITAAGKTCAIALSGLENLYPADSAPVFEQVIKSGCVFSEYSPELEFRPEHTNEANRLVTSLAQAVVIGEVNSDTASDSNSENEISGAMDVARSCVESGKLLFVLVPSEVPIHDEKALEPFVELGAVPVKYPEDMNTILKCLV
jgi:DNA processing protein